MTDRTAPAYAAPFVVGRGRIVGYQAILAPDFVCRSGDAPALASSVQHSDQPRQTIAELPVSGPITVVHSSMQVTRSLIGAGGAVDDRPIVDEHSRPLEIIYGLVLRGTFKVDLARADLGEVTGPALSTYSEFLQSESTWEVRCAAALDSPVATVPSPGPRPGRNVQPRTVQPPQIKTVAYVAGATVVAAALAWAALKSGTTPTLPTSATPVPTEAMVATSSAPLPPLPDPTDPRFLLFGP